jgi:peptidoglycan L-alanyl-D-glutamate endopeptidase CwlK
MNVPIIDSNITLEIALIGKDIPQEIKDNLAIVNASYLSFDGLFHVGQLVVHKGVAQEVEEIFNQLAEMRFPIGHVIPVGKYDWDDDISMAENNSSAFNYRFIQGTERLSNHSFGLAIDINPVQNPYVRSDGSTIPEGSTYDLTQPGTITPEIAKVFQSFGWKWGGDWNPKDWQHFEKPSAIK